MKQRRFRAANAVFEATWSHKAKIVYLYLRRCADTDGRAFPSVSNIAWACSLSERSAQMALRELEDAGGIQTVTRKRMNGSQTSSLYYAEIPEKCWFFAPDDLFSLRISSAAKLAYCYLCRMADKDAISWPSRKRMAAALGYSLSSLDRARRELEEAGVLIKASRYRENGGQSSNLYIVQQPQAQPRQTKLRLGVDNATQSIKKIRRSLAALHGFVAAKLAYFQKRRGGLFIFAPLKGYLTCWTLHQKERYTQKRNLLPLPQPP